MRAKGRGFSNSEALVTGARDVLVRAVVSSQMGVNWVRGETVTLGKRKKQVGRRTCEAGMALLL